MKLFLDSANLEELKQACEWGIIDGVTTNPSLIAREGNSTDDQIYQLCQQFDGDVSASVLAATAPEIIAEGRHLSRLHKNVVVKVALTENGIKAISVLSREGIRVNVTLCFNAAQALLAAKAGAYLVSPFAGRVDDIGGSGIEMISDIVKIFSIYGFQTKVLAASIRTPRQVIEAAKIGTHICTLPFKLLQQMFHHPLTEKGVEQFAEDYRKAFDLITA